jgi:hypothetical protein
VNPHGELREQYADFARHARRDSACFADWAEGVLDDPEVLAWLGDLPAVKQQPNLVFAAARWHGVPAPGPYAGLRAALLGDDGPVRATITARSTQTNEAGRLATLTPALAGLAGGRPLALLEVGASAGLCLYPDRWSYRWHTSDRPGTAVTSGAGPLLECRVTGPFPHRVDVPAVAWRRGLDLHPLDVTDADQTAWLETLVWPEHDDRRAQLRRAIGIARAEPPVIETGDLLTEVPRLVEEAAGHGLVVVFHSAVVAYLADADRERFHDLMAGLVADGRCHWVSNEGPRVLPRITATAGEDPPETGFTLGVDGRVVAWTHGHGRAMRWLGRGQPTSAG